MKFQPSITPLAQVLKGLPCLVALGLAAPMASMAETWNVATGNWNDPLNWTPNLVPTPGSGTAVINNGGTVTLDSAVPNVDVLQLTGASILNVATGAALTANTGSEFTGGAVANVSGGTLTFANFFNLGTGGTTGVVNQTGGTVNVNNQWMAIGLGGGAAGSAYNLSGGTLATTVGVEVGSDRAGDMTISGTGTANLGNVEVGVRNNGNGHLTIGSGTLNTSTVTIGSREAGSSGVVDLSGTGLMNLTGALIVGNVGGGTFNQTGGTLNLNGNQIQVGQGGGTGILNFSSGTISNLHSIFAGRNGGTGTFNQTGGTIGFNGAVQAALGTGAGSTGTLNISGSSTVMNNTSSQDWQLGFNGGTGRLNVTAGGKLNHNWWINLARGAGSVGSITVDGAGSEITQSAGRTNVGEDGLGTLTISNGGKYSSTDEFAVGQNGGSTGTLTLSGATSELNLTSHLFVGRNGNGTFNQSGGTLNLNGRRMQIADAGGSTGVVNLTGGAVNNSEWIHVGSGGGANGTLNITYPSAGDTLTTGALYVGNGGSTGLINVNNGTLNATGVIEVGRIGSGTGTLNISGAGSTVNAYTGGGLDGFVRIGTNSGNGTVNVSAGGKLNTNGGWLTLGDAEGGGQGATGVVTATGAGTTITTRGIIVGWFGSTTGTLSISDGAVVNNTVHELSVGRDFNAGNNPTGIVNISSGGVLNAGGETRIGHNSTGIVNINGGTLNMQGGGWAIVGDGGAANGTVNLSSGNVNVTADRFVLGQNAGAVGTYNQTGGATEVGNEFNVGRGGGTGTLNLDGGTFNVNGWTTLGRDGAGTGTINVRNGAAFTHLQNGGDMLVGWNNGSHGTINVESGGTVVQNWWTRVGVDGGSNGAITVDGAGSKFTVGAGRTYIGESGSGTLTVTDGGKFEHLNGGEQFNVGGNDGRNSAAVGVVTISDAGSMITSASMFGFGRGQSGGIRSSGTLNISGGTVSTPGWIGFGQDGGSGTLNMSGGTLSAGTELHVGIDTNGFATQSVGVANMTDGTINVGTTLFVGRNGGSGTFTKTGGVINVTNSLEVGRNGTGTLTNAGGNVNVNGFYVGNAAGAVGTVNITDGIVTNTGWVDVGGGGTGTVNVNGPNARFFGSISDMQIGTGAGGVGVVNVQNGGQMTHNWWINVGRGGGSQGTVLVEGAGSKLTQGTRVDTQDSRFNIGADPNDGNNVQSGTLTISDGGWVERTALGGELNVGRNTGSTGTLTIDTGGRFTSAGGTAFIGVNGGTGAMNLSDTGSEFIHAGEMHVGINPGATGTVNHNGGTLGVSNLRIATNSSTGTYNFVDGTINVPGDMTIGWQGSAVGSMIISGGVANVNNDTYVGVDATATGTLRIQGGTLSTGHLIVARDGGNTGTVHLDSGVLAANFITNAAGTALVNFNGATVRARSNRTNFFEGFTFGNSEILAGGLVFDSNGFDVSALNNLDGSGGLTKIGTGTARFLGNSVFSGGTLVSAGTLVGGGRGLGSGAVDVGPTGILSVGTTGNTGLASLYFNSAPADNGGFDAAYNTLSSLRGRIGSLNPATVITTPVMNINNGGATIPAGVGPDFYQGYYSGMINITNAGSYTFATGSDDGSMVWIDGQLIVNNNHFQGFSFPQVSGAITLAPGRHNIVVGFYEGGGGDSLRVGVSGPDTGDVLIDLGTGGPAVTPDLVIGSLLGSGAVELSTGNLILGTDNTSTTHSGVISHSGGGPVFPGLLKVGSGTQTLTGTNTFGGGLTLAAGKLILGGAGGSAAGTGDLTIATSTGWPTNGVELASNQTVGVVRFNGTDFGGLRPEGFTLIAGGLDSTNGKGVIENVGLGQPNAPGNGTVIVNTTTGNTYSFNGYIRNNDANGTTTLSLVKEGSGTQELSGTNITYTGTTTINGGTLKLNTGNQQGTLAGQGVITINNGGTLMAGAVDATGFHSNSGANFINVNQGGTLTVAAGQRLSMDRDLNVVGGTVTSAVGASFDNGASYSFRDSGNGPINHYNFTSAPDGTSSVLSAKDAGLNGNATFTVADGPGDVDMNVTGNLVDNFGAGSFTKSGPGTVRFAGNNTYTGATNLTGGTLLMGASNVLPDSAAFNLSGGTILRTDGFSDTTGPIAVNGAAVFDMGTGSGSELTFSNVTAWTGMLQIWNYNGASWTAGQDKLLFTAGSGAIDLAKVNFYSDNGLTQIGSGGGGLIGNELVPVPEPGAILAAGLLGLIMFRRESRQRATRR